MGRWGEITRPKAAAATVDRRSIERVIYGRSSAFDEKEWGYEEMGGGKGDLGVKKKEKRRKEEKEKSDRSDACNFIAASK